MAEEEEKKQISFGKLISKESYYKTRFIPEEVKNSIRESNYYLLIFIPGDDTLKVSIFPCLTPSIKKVLIKLKEFSPELVKGISDVLRDFHLGDATIHTTGLCFSGSQCFYETYLDIEGLKQRNIELDIIRKKFLEVPRVEDVKIVDIYPSEI